jgi:hypothetical protein
MLPTSVHCSIVVKAITATSHEIPTRPNSNRNLSPGVFDVLLGICYFELPRNVYLCNSVFKCVFLKRASLSCDIFFLILR